MFAYFICGAGFSVFRTWLARFSNQTEKRRNRNSCRSPRPIDKNIFQLSPSAFNKQLMVFIGNRVDHTEDQCDYRTKGML